ncbi:GNAT family N-acetyltransferase [Atopobium fossor]|uniref:GNAT family N-acetyltransferase n=1 Tax=Atopobium fossor TaxID=39487 RepID=UPI00041D3B2F|nr:GNAT family N-acetyltransferase [Atopobium fossor]
MSMPRRCTKSDRAKVLEYISKDPEVTTFIMGDIEQFGMSDPVSVFALTNEDGSWDSIVLKFYANFVCYSQNQLFDALGMAQLIKEETSEMLYGSINGPYEVIAAIAPYFDDLSVTSSNLARLTAINTEKIAPAPDGTIIRPLSAEDYDDLFALLASTDEYHELYCDARSVAMAKQQKAADAAHGCLTYGAFYEGKLVSTASTSANNSQSSMIVGVCTRKDMRNYGLATAVVARLCADELAAGKKFLTLFYDNPTAGHIYKRIGFEGVAQYAMLR